MLRLVPTQVDFRSAQAKSAAEVDDFDAAAEHGGREFHGDLGRRRQEHCAQALGGGRIGRARNDRVAVRQGRNILGIGPVLHQNGLRVRVAFEDANRLRAAIPPEPYDAYLVPVHD